MAKRKFPILPESARKYKLLWGVLCADSRSRRPSTLNFIPAFLLGFEVITLMTPPMAPEPYLALAAPWIISM